MKITDVKTFPYDGGFRDLVFVKVETDEGVYGWGEAGGMGRERACEATVQEIKPYFIGQDPGQIELLWNTVYRDAYRRPQPPESKLNKIDCCAKLAADTVALGLVMAGASHRIPFTEGELS